MKIYEWGKGLNRCRKLRDDTRGQALIETAIFCAFFVFLAALSADVAFLCYAAATTSSSARIYASYAAQGQKSPYKVAINSATISQTCSSGSWEMFEWGGYTNGPAYTVIGLTTSLGGTAWTQGGFCGQSTYYVVPPFASDPESAYFVPVVTQVNSSFQAPVPFRFPGINFLSLPTVIHGRPVYMRQLN